MEFFDDTNIERAALYRLFSSLFTKEPGEETLLTIQEMFQMRFDETPSEIGADFFRLFQDRAGSLRPYESLYNYPFGDKPRTWGTVTEKIQERYHAAGVMIDEETGLIPDHISAELSFMSYLIENGLADEQEEFLKDHLVVWIPGFCEDLKETAQTTFYREVADLLKEFVLSDQEEFETDEGE